MLNDYCNILKQINNGIVSSQRQLANVTDISLGKINKILKECMEKGYIHFDSNSSRYMLTIQGREYLRDTIKIFKQIRLHINNDKNDHIQTVVILAAGNTKDFKQPIGTLQVGDMTILERQIKILKSKDIHNIYIITGYKQEAYHYLEEIYGCKCIENTNYKNTGSMYSLSLAKEYIKEDFLLLEGDLVFERKVIDYLIDGENRDAIVVTDISGFGDEEYVELQEGNIAKISKDIHQINKIYGELMGVAKISIELYELMLKEFNEESNPYLSYEYVLFDLAKDYYIPYIKIEDLIWGEVDNELHYEKVLKDIWPKIQGKERETEANV